MATTASPSGSPHWLNTEEKEEKTTVSTIFAIVK
jgi:hypothetical protein